MSDHDTTDKFLPETDSEVWNYDPEAANQPDAQQGDELICKVCGEPLMRWHDGFICHTTKRPDDVPDHRAVLDGDNPSLICGACAEPLRRAADGGIERVEGKQMSDQSDGPQNMRKKLADLQAIFDEHRAPSIRNLATALEMIYELLGIKSSLSSNLAKLQEVTQSRITALESQLAAATALHHEQAESLLVLADRNMRLAVERDRLAIEAERLMAEQRRTMLALESLTPGGSEFVGDVERCVAHVRARQTVLLDNIKRQVRLRVDLANERDDAIVAVTRLEAEALTLRQQREEANIRLRDASRLLDEMCVPDGDNLGQWSVVRRIRRLVSDHQDYINTVNLNVPDEFRQPSLDNSICRMKDAVDALRRQRHAAAEAVAWLLRIEEQAEKVYQLRTHLFFQEDEGQDPLLLNDAIMKLGRIGKEKFDKPELMKAAADVAALVGATQEGAITAFVWAYERWTEVRGIEQGNGDLLVDGRFYALSMWHRTKPLEPAAPVEVKP